MSRAQRPARHSRPIGHFGDDLSRQFTQTDNNKNKSLTFAEKKHDRCKSKIVRTVNYSRDYVTVVAVLIIFPVILQTVIKTGVNVYQGSMITINCSERVKPEMN